ncbi:hypothetical protein V8E53_008302 [Lactarius tabidus]|jgi:hypothetical protein
MPPTAHRFASADRCAHRQTRRRILIVIALLVLRPRLGATCGFSWSFAPTLCLSLAPFPLPHYMFHLVTGFLRYSVYVYKVDVF